MRIREIRSISMIFVACVLMFTGCALDHRDTVPAKTERITLEREHAFLVRSEGVPVLNGPWTMQKHNHGNGPCVAYDFDMSIQNYENTLKVKTRDNINMPVTLEVSWQMISGSTMIAALNFMPSDRIGVVTEKDGKQIIERFTAGTGNSIQHVTVPIEIIFERNVQDFLDEVGRDVIDRQLSKGFEREVVSLDVMSELKKRLKSIRLPRVIFDPKVGVVFPDVKYEGTKLIYDGPTVCILDVIDINRIMVRQQNPDFINDEITKISELEAEVTGLRAELGQWETRKKTRLKAAEHARQTSINIGKALELNPLMPQLQRLNNWKVIIASAKADNNTKFRFVPIEMFGKTTFDLSAKKK